MLRLVPNIGVLLTKCRIFADIVRIFIHGARMMRLPCQILTIGCREIGGLLPILSRLCVDSILVVGWAFG